MKLSRNADPDTSRESAKEVVQSGVLGRQLTLVLDALREKPLSTSAELADFLNLPNGRAMTARRLPDLEKKGLVTRQHARICKVTGRSSITWSVDTLGWMLSNPSFFDDPIFDQISLR